MLNQKKKIQHVTRKCPNCLTTLGYDQHTRNDNTRQLRCNKISCNSILISKYSALDKKFEIFLPEVHEEKVKCEVCSSVHMIELPIYEGAHVKEKCSCANIISMKYGDEGIHIIQSKPAVTPPREITEEFLQQVLALLPPQPWDKEVHKQVAKELNETNRMVQKAIKQLIKRGDLYDQVDGRLFETREVSIS